MIWFFLFLNSFLAVTEGKYNDKVEFLIKLDSDNEIALNEYIKCEGFKRKYPQLQIRPVVFGRWEGRKSLYSVYHFLFTRKNPSSKFIVFYFYLYHFKVVLLNL